MKIEVLVIFSVEEIDFLIKSFVAGSESQFGKFEKQEYIQLVVFRK